MREPNQRYEAIIYFTQRGKPYSVSYVLPNKIGESFAEDLPTYDALDFQFDAAVDDITKLIRDRFPDIDVRHAFRDDLPMSTEAKSGLVDREEFNEIWIYKLKVGQDALLAHIENEFLRNLPVKLEGEDRVKHRSGWFHYPIDIETSKRHADQSLIRLKALITNANPERGVDFRDIAEEAYFEQVQRQRLAIYERRRENWRVIRWGATTVLGLVLAFGSMVSVWDKLFG